MTGKTHLLIGLTGGLALALATGADIPTALLMAAAGAFGGVTPDIDTPNSTISRKAWIARIPLFWIPHRTLTHSLIASVGVGLLALALGQFAAAFAAGYVSHIGADMTTQRGIPLFYPLWRRDLHLLPPGFRLRTGGPVESLAYLACMVLLVGLVLHLFGVDLNGLKSQIMAAGLF